MHSILSLFDGKYSHRRGFDTTELLITGRSQEAITSMLESGQNEILHS